MNPLESRVRRLLWYVDQDKWERESQLLRLIAKEAGASLIELTPGVLAELGGRSPSQAAYDHRALVRLAQEHRVLQRWNGPGRQSDVWRLVLDIRKWRHVPWLPRRIDVLRDASVELTVVAVELTVKTAGQRWSRPFSEAGTASNPSHPKMPTRAFALSQRRSTVFHRRSTPQTERETEAPTTVNSTDQPPATPLTSLSDNHSLPDPPNDSAEGVREGSSAQAVRELAWQVKEHLDPALTVKALQLRLPPVAVEVGSTMWDRVWGIAAKYEGDPAILLARCDGFSGRMFSLQRALDELEMWVAAGPTPIRPERPVGYLEESAATLRRRIATYRRVDPDDEHIPDMEAELRELEEQLGVTADG